MTSTTRRGATAETPATAPGRCSPNSGRSRSKSSAIPTPASRAADRAQAPTRAVRRGRDRAVAVGQGVDHWGDPRISMTSTTRGVSSNPSRQSQSQPVVDVAAGVAERMRPAVQGGQVPLSLRGRRLAGGMRRGWLGEFRTASGRDGRALHPRSRPRLPHTDGRAIQGRANVGSDPCAAAGRGRSHSSRSRSRRDSIGAIPGALSSRRHLRCAAPDEVGNCRMSTSSCRLPPPPTHVDQFGSRAPHAVSSVLDYRRVSPCLERESGRWQSVGADRRGPAAVVVVGAGFAGFHCLRTLERRLPPGAAVSSR